MPDSVVTPGALKEGLPPGTPVFTGEPGTGKSVLNVFDFTAERLERYDDISPAEIMSFLQTDTVSWIDCVGLEDVAMIKSLCEGFGVHPLAIEDIVQPGTRPKMDDYEDFLFLVVKTIEVEDDGVHVHVETEHVSLVLGPSFVLTFQERRGDPFDRVRRRLLERIGRIRKRGPDYLAYALIDAIVDHYFVELHEFGEDVEDFEDTLMVDPPADALVRIQDLRTADVQLRRAIRPLRDAIGALRVTPSELIHPDSQPYLRDLFDHVTAANDTVELYRDMIMGMIALYHTGVSNRLNDTMKVLTVISTIFIPLTFLSGLYGMNFEYMPELKWRGGYFAVLTTMVIISAAMAAFFRVRRWF